MTFGLQPKSIDMIRNIFRKHPEITEVKIFGSRAIDTYRDNSDIDLIISDNIDDVLLAKIAAELDELPLPYLFDLKTYHLITHPGLREHIDKFAKQLYLKEII